MSLFEEITPPPPPVPEPVKVHIEPVVFDGITIDTQYVPTSAFQMWSAGSFWTCDYYSQVLGRSNEPTPQDLDRQPVYQQYRLIKKMPLKVDSTLSFDQDDATRVFTVTGSGYTYPFLVPNKGDMFIANIGDGRLGVFTITECRRATILKDSIYSISWTMVSELTPERMADFEAKTVDTLYFSSNSLQCGCGPFITEGDVERNERYTTYLAELIKRYCQDFFSYRHSTMLVPDQVLAAYDHFTTQAFLKIVSSIDNPEVRRIRPLNVGAARVMYQPTIWDALLNQDVIKLHGSTAKANLVACKNLLNYPTLQAIGYSGVPYMIYPMDAPTDVDSQYSGRNRFMPVGIPLSEGKPRRPLPGGSGTQASRHEPCFQPGNIADPDLEPWRLPPDIKPVVCDNYYVFSEAFYLGELGQSKLELLVGQYLNKETMRLEALDHILGKVYDWDNLERYFYYPVLIILLKSQLR